MECPECDGTGNFYRNDEDGDFLRCDLCGGSGSMGDASLSRLEGRELGSSCDRSRGGQETHGPTEQSGRTLFPPGPSDREQWAVILRERPDLAPAVESEIRGVASGSSGGMDFSRANQLRSLGNLVVPIQGAAALLTLLQRVTA